MPDNNEIPIRHRLLLSVWRHLPSAIRRAIALLGASKFAVGTNAVCLNSRNELLLLCHRFHPERPWGFPGGWADRGESPIQAIVREIREETGFHATVEGLLCVLGDGMAVEVYYLCRVPDGTPRLQASEMRDYRWVDPLDCPLPLHRNQKRILEIVQAQLRGEPHPMFPVTEEDL